MVAMTLNRKKRYSCAALLFCLIAAALMMNASIGAGYCESGIQTMNASGNRNVPLSVDLIGKSEGYATVLYNNTNGLPTSEANTIAQTSEGFIWIGSYYGLICYDGNTFERIDSGVGLGGVESLYVDGQDRLWIGTNDSGFAVMERGKFQRWDIEEGLKSSHITSIAGDENDLIYISTTAGIFLINEDRQLSSLSDSRLDGAYIGNLRSGNDGLMYGSTASGDIFTLKDGKVVTYVAHEESGLVGSSCFFPDPEIPGNVYLGLETSEILYGTLNDEFKILRVLDIAPLYFTKGIEYIDGKIWICAQNGIGVVEDEEVYILEKLPMNNSVLHMITDHDGNLWVVSKHQGVMKIVPNQFADIFDRYDLPEAVVNSTCMLDSKLFIGSDTGLIVLDDEKPVTSIPLTKASTASGVQLESADLIELLKDCRIRSIIRDSKERLWISTWRNGYGVIRYDHGEVIAFTPEDGLFSDRVRVCLEQQDGTILAVNTGGVSVIQGDHVQKNYGQDEGIVNIEGLTVASGPNGEIVLGTNGGSIYVLDENGIRHIGREEGLSSEVVMRIKYDAGRKLYWLVTSNSIAFMTEDYHVTTIRHFPYVNNFDLYENSKGDIWVLSSNGIYIASAEELLKNGDIHTAYYGMVYGLPSTPLANSYSELTETGDLYIACSSGVVKVNIEKPLLEISKTSITLPYIEVDGKRIYPNLNGEFNIPSNTHKLTLFGYVFNYSLTDFQIAYCLEGFDTTDTTLNRNDLAPVSYTNLPSGTYSFVMRVKDSTGVADQSAAFRIIKENPLTDEAAGSIIMSIVSLFLMTGLLTYTALYRKRGRLDDKLFFIMILVNIVLAVAELMSYLQEGLSFPLTRELMIAENTVYYAALETFPYLFLIHSDYCAYRDRDRTERVMVVYGIPCFLCLVILLVNLKTGWVFSISEINTYCSGLLDEYAILPMLFYFLITMTRMYKINKRLVALDILMAVGWFICNIWFNSLLATAFGYTLFLISTHLDALNRSIIEE